MSISEHQKRKLSYRLVSGSFWAVLGKVLGAVTGLLINSILARLITPADMGRYFLIISFVTAAVFLVQFGAQQFVVRNIAAALVGQDRAKESSAVIWSVLRFGFVNALVVYVVLIMSGFLIPVRELLGISSVVVALGAFLVAGRALNGLIVESLRGLHDIKNASIFRLAAANIFTLIGLIMFWIVQSRPNLEEILLVTCIAAFLSLAGAWNILGKRLSARREVVMLGIKPLAIMGIPLFITSISTFLFSQADLWVVGTMIGADAAGIYGAAVRLVQLIYIPLLITNAVLPPIISELWMQDRIPQLERVIRGMGTIAGIPAVIILTAFIIWAPELLHLVYGEFYAAGKMVLIVVSIGYMFNALSGSAQVLLIMAGYDRLTMAINVLFGTLLVLSLLVVVPIFGINGAAAVTGAALALQAFTTWFVARRVTGIYTHFSFHHLKLALSVALSKHESPSE